MNKKSSHTTTSIEKESHFDYFAEKIEGLPNNWKEVAEKGQFSVPYRKLRAEFNQKPYDHAVEMILEMYGAFSFGCLDKCSDEKFKELEKAIKNKNYVPGE